MNDEERKEAERLVMEAHALVGKVATGFAALEFHLQFLVSFLISGNEMSPEAVITTRRLQFAERLDLLKDLTRLRLPPDTEMRAKAMELIDDLNSLREKRNLYVHGFWLINYPLIAFDNMVRVSDPKWRYNKQDETWHSMGTTDVSLESLRSQIYDNGRFVKQVHDLIESIKSANLTAPTQPQPPVPAP